MACVTWDTSLGDGGSSVILSGEDVTARPLNLKREGE